jgi:DNA ligase-1
LDQRLVAFQAELDAMYGSALEDGFEGLIARNLGGLYKFGRSTAASQDALKLKPFADSDAVVLSVFEAMANQNEAFTDELGRTKRSTHAAGLVGKGTLGGFICRDVASGVEFSCAPGLLSHAEREALWAIGGCVGRILKYRHLPVGVKDLPRHPRFIGWRSSIEM